jgi:hypothetical protein
VEDFTQDGRSNVMIKKMSADALVAIDLTDDERLFMFHGLNEWLGPARGAPLLLPVFGMPTADEFYDMAQRLGAAIRNTEPLSDLDWARALLLTEISWGSDLLGAGIDSATNFRDEMAVGLLRSIQYKISSSERRQLLQDNAGRAAAD